MSKSRLIINKEDEMRDKIDRITLKLSRDKLTTKEFHELVDERRRLLLALYGNN